MCVEEKLDTPTFIFKLFMPDSDTEPSSWLLHCVTDRTRRKQTGVQRLQFEPSAVCIIVKVDLQLSASL